MIIRNQNWFFDKKITASRRHRVTLKTWKKDMKSNVILKTSAVIVLAVLTLVWHVFGQTSLQNTSQANIQASSAQAAAVSAARTKAADALAKATAQVQSNPTMLKIFPPRYFDMMEGMADGTLPPTIFMSLPAATSSHPTHLKPGAKTNMKWLDATFLMGSPSTEAERNSDESQYTAIISYGFYMGNFEVTQDEYQQIMGNNPSYFTPANGYTADLDRPVENVSWGQADAYCAALTQQALASGSIQSGWVYRLPTEAEWEYSCRGKSAPAHIIASQTDHSSVTSTWYGAFNETLPPITGTLDSFDMYVGQSPDGFFGGGPFNASDLTIEAMGSGNAGYIFANTDFTSHGTIPNGAGNRSVGFVHIPLGTPAVLTGQAITIRLRNDSEYSGAIMSMGDDGVGHPYFVGYDSAPSTLNAFSFGSSIRGGEANFDTRYEYDAITGTLNVSSPTFPALNMTTNIGSYQANTFGLYDMHGNVAEWCQDYYGAYPTVTTVDPQGPTSGSTRVVRGGSWTDHGVQLRSAARLGVDPGTASSHVGFRIVLAPGTPPWKTAVVTQPSIKTYGIPPTKDSTKDGLVLVTHGWTKFAPDQSWIDTMSNSISTYLAGAGVTDWQVYGYYWAPNSATPFPDGALVNATQEGISLGNSIVNQGWTKVHLIAHSAGAQLIQTATEVIKGRAPSTVVQCTFLDPYVGTDYAGRTTYGNGADWSDRYASSHDIDALEGIFTDVPLYSSYNVDVTALDPSLGNSGLFIGLSGYVICSLYDATHGWAIQFYQNSITGNITSDYDGFGFLLSKEAGGWPNAPTQYPVGNVNSVRVLGTAPQSCSLLGAIAATAGIPIDFTASPKAAQSTSGTIVINGIAVTLITGSPAWLSIVPTNTNPVNLLSFDANFTSSGTGAAGLLSVLWDSDTIGTLDERTIGQGVAHYAYHFTATESNSTHVLSFRLDPFTNVQSTIVISNVVLSQQGVVQPFTLSTTTNTVNGLHVWQLTGQAGFDYGLQASTNLTDWTQIAVLEDTNGVVSFSDQSSTNYPMRFYRVVAPY